MSIAWRVSAHLHPLHWAAQPCQTNHPQIQSLRLNLASPTSSHLSVEGALLPGVDFLCYWSLPSGEPFSISFQKILHVLFSFRNFCFHLNPTHNSWIIVSFPSPVLTFICLPASLPASSLPPFSNSPRRLRIPLWSHVPWATKMSKDLGQFVVQLQYPFLPFFPKSSFH